MGEFIIYEGTKTLSLKHAFCRLSRLLLNNTSQSGRSATNEGDGQHLGSGGT